MDIRNHSASLLPALLVVLAPIPNAPAHAQTFTALHSFSPLSSATNQDGSSPYAGLVLLETTLYGVASGGGPSGSGTVFSLNTDGTGFRILHSFAASSGYTNNDGMGPRGKLTLSTNILYGTTSTGGKFASGTLFRVKTDGTGFTNLHHFTATPLDGITNSDGAAPSGGLLLSGSTLYGMTSWGGRFGYGTIFAINIDGTDFRTLYEFTAVALPEQINADGANPSGEPIIFQNRLYGTAMYGGTWGAGTLFAVSTNGTGFTNLHSFYAPDGDEPVARLLSYGNTLYGTTSFDGPLAGDSGTAFKVQTDGTGFEVLQSFSDLDAYAPYAGLVLSGNTLYGTELTDFSNGSGGVFAVNTDGSGFTNLHTFTAGEGSRSYSEVLPAGTALYGTTAYGGSANEGTVFRLSFPPQLTITSSGRNVVLSWPTNVAGFDYSAYQLQSAPNVNGLFTNVPGANGSSVTNPVAGARQFFRLTQ